MKSRRRLDCLVAGDANLDLMIDGVIELTPGTEKLAQSMELVLGGSSSVTAFNLSCLGLKVGLASVVGDDAFGDVVMKSLRLGGVDLRLVRRTDKKKTGLTIWHSKDRQRAATTYPGTIEMLKARDIPDEALAQTKHLHVGAYFLLKGLQPGAEGLFRRARRAGCTISLDCNYDPLERWDSGLRKALGLIDVFMPNDDEARYITGLADVEAAARELAKRCRIVVIKRGAEGALVCSKDGMASFPAKKAKVVDTTGAGDSFNAGFLSQFIGGAALAECANAGLAAAALCIGRVGGTEAFAAMRR